MLALAHLIDRLLHTVAPALAGIALLIWIIAFGRGVVASWRQPPSRPRLPRVVVSGLIAAVAVVVVLFGAQSFVAQGARDEIRQRLDGQVKLVLLDSAPLATPDDLLGELRRMGPWRGYHHTHPTTSYQLRVQTSRGALDLILRRDSENPREYWVFCPAFEVTRRDDAGHIITAALDSR